MLKNTLPERKGNFPEFGQGYPEFKSGSQFVEFGNMNALGFGGSGFCPEYKAIYDAMVVKPSRGEAVIWNNFVKNTKSILLKCDGFFNFSCHTNNNGEALINWANILTPATLSFDTGGSLPTFIAHQGFTCNTINKSFINTNINPFSGATKLKLNSATLGIYSRKLSQVLNSLAIGNDNNKLVLAPRMNATTIHRANDFLARVNDGGSFVSSAQDYAGWAFMCRNSATQKEIYKHNVQTVATVTSTSFTNASILIGKVPGWNVYNQSQFSAAIIAEGLSQEEITLLANEYEKAIYQLDYKIAIIGDSTIGEHSTYYAVSELMANDRYAVTDISLSGATIAAQKSSFLALGDDYLKTLHLVYVEIGINNLGSTESILLSDYQDLVSTIRTKIGVTNKIILGTLTPCKSYIGANYSKWLALNVAIRGSGATPITGANGYIDQHTIDLNDGNDNLAAIYDSGDHVHEIDAGRQIIANLWDAKFNELFPV